MVAEASPRASAAKHAALAMETQRTQGGPEDIYAQSHHQRQTLGLMGHRQDQRGE